MTSVEPSLFSSFHFACFTNAYICCLLTFPFMVTEGSRTVRANASIPSSLPPFFVIWTWTRHRSSISSEQRGLRAAEVFTVMDQPDPHLYPRAAGAGPGRGGCAAIGGAAVRTPGEEKVQENRPELPGRPHAVITGRQGPQRGTLCGHD